MEDKKMRLNIIKVPLYTFILFAFLFVLLFVLISIDYTPYKRIGKTEYYLLETMAQSSDGSALPGLYRLVGDNYVGVSLSGYPKHIFWDNDYILVKCTDGNRNDIITTYCIIKQVGKYDYLEKWDVRLFSDSKDYETAIKKLHLDEFKMDYTDAKIPWSLHLFD